jgi:uncharacterized glyoxalase superfamily protein PhnB/uncharacterized protein YndB with AHSA1/START domain
MKNLQEMIFEVDKINLTIHVERSFDADLPLVWAAWTEAEILDEWWAPKPYKNETKFMDFREGGYWLYSMLSPEGERHWCRADYHKIEKHQYYIASDDFCDENGVVTNIMPSARWNNSFIDNGDQTRVVIKIEYKSLEDLEKIISLGFKEGFSMGMDNLDQYIQAQFELRKQNKTSNKARVTTYLNFPGNTEEAMKFYQKVFRGKFVGKGLQHFEDVAMPSDAPPLSDEIKKMVLHAELEILPGFILMATDAPESMGFTLVHGNNMHINVEPESREETERLFAELSDGGTVTMPLKDMFFGAYFAELKDKYGINWMLTHQNS